jgi:hypothetical protein
MIAAHFRAAHVILDRITSHRLGESDSRSSVAPVADAEDAVIDEWAEFHDDLLDIRRTGSSVSPRLASFSSTEVVENRRPYQLWRKAPS